MEIVKLLYDAYPDSTKIDENNPKRNLIHNGLYNEVDKNMMKFLCANYPDALHGYSQDRYDRQEIAISVKQIPRRISPPLLLLLLDSTIFRTRKTPLHELCYQHADSRFRCLKTMCEVDSSIVRKGCGAGSNRLGEKMSLF